MIWICRSTCIFRHTSRCKDKETEIDRAEDTTQFIFSFSVTDHIAAITRAAFPLELDFALVPATRVTIRRPNRGARECEVRPPHHEPEARCGPAPGAPVVPPEGPGRPPTSPRRPPGEPRETGRKRAGGRFPRWTHLRPIVRYIHAFINSKCAASYPLFLHSGIV